MPQNTINLPATPINAPRPTLNFSSNTFWGHNTIPRHHYIFAERPGQVIFELVFETEGVKKETEKEYEAQVRRTPLDAGRRGPRAHRVTARFKQARSLAT